MVVFGGGGGVSCLCDVARLSVALGVLPKDQGVVLALERKSHLEKSPKNLAAWHWPWGFPIRMGT